MIGKIVVGLALAMALTGTAEASQSLFGNQTRFDGKVKIKKFSGSGCAAVAGFKGKSFRAVFRAKLKSNQPAEGFSLSITQLAGGIFVVAEGDGTFAGTNQNVSGNLILDAWRMALPAGKVSLTFTPPVDKETNAFGLSGTYKNFLFANCTATVSGSFARRP